MRSPARTGKNVSQRWRLVWSGSGSAWPGLAKLIWVVLRLLLAGWVWGTAVRLAHFQPPVKTAGVVLAVVSVLLLVWGVWGLWRSISILGFKRLIVTLVFVYGLAVIINVLTIPDSRSFPARLLTQLSFTGQQGWGVFTSWVSSALQGPDEFMFAYTGRRSPPALPPGFPTPDPKATPVQVFVVAAGAALPPASSPTQQPEETAPPGQPAAPPHQPALGELNIGGYAQVINTKGQTLRARAGPGTTFEIVARFQEGSRLLILDGPESDGKFTWWKVSNEQGEGWCADQWLSPIE